MFRMPESQIPSGAPGVPEVVLWALDSQTHSTVSPTSIVSVDGLKDRFPFGPTVTVKVFASAAAPPTSENSAINRMSKLHFGERFPNPFPFENKNSLFIAMVLFAMVIVFSFDSRKALAVTKG